MSILTETQCRTARALLNWSQTDLAKKANLSESTIRDFEKRRRVPSRNNLAAIIAAFEHAGVELLREGQAYGVGGEGARFVEDGTNKKLENEKLELEKELSSARALLAFLHQQADTNAIKENDGFRRIMRQAERDVTILEVRIMHINATLSANIVLANKLAEQVKQMMDEPLAD